MKHKLTALLTLTFLAACGEAPTEPTLIDVAPAFALTPVSITNGSFESLFTGWTSGDVDLVFFWQAADGIASIDLNALSPGFVSQDITTVPGTDYVVQFALAGNPGLPQNVKEMEVSAAGALATYTFDTSGKSVTNMGWVEESFTFTATGSTTTLAFTSLHAGNPFAGLSDPAQGPALDNVRVFASGPANPETKADCKKGGWEQYGFRNQGQCIRFVNTGKDSR
jgi:choice-of-anchor C domain-containing protein